MKDGDLHAPAGRAPAEAPPRLGDVRHPLIVDAKLAPSAGARPLLARPNDPLIAADVRVMAQEIVGECLEAGSAEVVSEVAMPLQAHALALLLNLSPDHADEWISWGLEGLDHDADTPSGAGRSVTEYVDRQLINARRSRERDFFAALDRAEIDGRRPDFDSRRQLAVRLLSGERARIVAVLAGALDWLAAEPCAVRQLRSDRGVLQQSVKSLLRALPADDAGLGLLPGPFVRQHAGLLLRVLLSVVAGRVERLTVIRRQLRPDDHPVEWHSLLLAFMPRTDGG